MTGVTILQLAFFAFGMAWAYIAGLNAQRRHNAHAVPGVSPSVSHRVVGSSHASRAAPLMLCPPRPIPAACALFLAYERDHVQDVDSRDLPAPSMAV